MNALKVSYGVEFLRKTDCCVLIPVKDRFRKLPRETVEMVNPKELVMSFVKGLGKARNDLAKHSKAPYLLFIDTEVSFSKDTFETFILPAIQEKKLLIYKGNNDVMCTKVFGISRKLFYLLGGFDETFHFGEDIEFGLRLKTYGSLEDATVIPTNLIEHSSHKETGSYLVSLCVRARCAFRYEAYWLLDHMRKKDYVGRLLLPFIFVRYLLYNPRQNILLKRKIDFKKIF